MCLLADFLSNTICSNGAVWQEIIWNNELVKYIKTNTLLINIQNVGPAKKILIAVYSVQIILLLAKEGFEIFGRVFHQEKMKQGKEVERNK